MIRKCFFCQHPIKLTIRDMIYFIYLSFKGDNPIKVCEDCHNSRRIKETKND